MEGVSRNMSSETRKPGASRPDVALRWGGRILFVTAVALIADIALQPGHATPPRLFGSDKIEHMLAFMTLMFTVRMGWPQRSVYLTGAIVLGYGVLIELLQATALVGRTASVGDVLADVAGLFIGLFLYTVLRRFTADV
jgi:VanZ family protein